MGLPMEVLIIGGGTTGLLLAQGLKLKGITATVFEREDAHTYSNRPREWGMTLHWAQEHIEKCIPPDMLEHLDRNICCDPFFKGETSVHHFNGQTGEMLMETKGKRPRRISRRKFRAYLSQGLDVKYGYKVAAISSDGSRVTAEFENGTKTSGTVLIGCDGSRSNVRQLFLGKERSELQDIDIQMFNISCRFSRDVALLQRDPKAPNIKLGYHPKGFMWFQSIQDVQDPDRPETWIYQNFLSWSGSPRPADFPDQASRLKHWQDMAKEFADPWKTTGEHLPKDLNWTTDTTTLWTPFDWADAELSSVVTLAGDAAHTLPPHRGQGLNNALEDASKLVDELTAVSRGQRNLPQALRAYEKDMRDRVVHEIPISKAQAQMIHSFDTLMDAPIFKLGIEKYRGERTAAGLDVETSA